MDYNIKIVKELVQEKKYNEAENMLLSTIQEAKVKKIEDENNTYYCFNNYIESLLFWNIYKPQKKNLNSDINYAEVYYYLAFINIEQKNFDKALEYLQEGLV
jgi:tetratricopeptide (TPR) repeat protein